MLGIALTCAIAACQGGSGTAPGQDADVDAAEVGALAVATAGDADAVVLADPTAGLPGTGHPGGGFASLPDRGDLVKYPAKPVVRREGPYTWHLADVSEAHALRAIVDGRLTITAPSGERLRFQYDRHVEHPTGDWSWVGHLVGGTAAEDAILTFGANAVFGTIAQPGGGKLGLDMRDGASWLVETDRAMLAKRSNAAGWYDQPDFLLPPTTPRRSAGPGRATMQALAPTLSQASATLFLDVLVGYTPGFATLHSGGPGGEVSLVDSRLAHMVEITNESYANSGLDMQVRLVHSMPVDYVDANDNGDALRELTGSDGGGQNNIPIPAALQPLHAARNQFGADMVVLVRRFNHPANTNCGVAWLIGGAQQPMDTQDELFGFSVVSDGQSGGFQCGSTTFAHELGHNMGLAHDVETAMGDDGVLDSNDYGHFPYSFGYRTGPGQGNFYTVMAYSDEQENSYFVFSNPDVTVCGGFPCGIENQADNARTLAQTAGIIAAFRATVVVEPPQNEAAGDMNGDGRSDLLWRNVASGFNTIWLSANSATGQAMSGVGGQAWRIVGNGDYDGDGKADVLWRNASTGSNVIWRSGNSATPQTVKTLVGAAWKVAGDGDFNGDGRSDILWRHAGIGYNTIWLSANSATGQAMSGVGPSWSIVGTGDYDGNGRSDVMWRHPNSGTNVIWRGADAASTQAVRTLAGDWEVAGDGDFDGDGRSDILWRHAGIGYNTIWRSGNSATGQAMTGVGPSWSIASTGDYDGDGRSDVLWRSNDTGSNVIWKGASASNTQPVTRLAGAGWIVAP